VHTLSTFRAARPEFAEATDSQVTAALVAAEAQTDVEVFGDLTDAAHMWLTAHLISATPGGVSARLKGEGFATLYRTERERLETLCCAGWADALISEL
jgi:hypothetical protein